MAIDRASSINLPEASLHLREFHAHFLCVVIGKRFNGALVDGTCGGETKVGGRLGDVEFEHFEAVFVGDGAGCALVDSHCVAGETALFFELAVHEVEGFGEFGGAPVDGLFEEVAEALDVDLAVDGFREVEVPDFEGDGVGEEVEAALVDLVGLASVRRV